MMGAKAFFAGLFGWSQPSKRASSSHGRTPSRATPPKIGPSGRAVTSRATATEPRLGPARNTSRHPRPPTAPESIAPRAALAQPPIPASGKTTSSTAFAEDGTPLGTPIVATESGREIVTAHARDYCAIFPDGTMWIHHNHTNDAEVMQAQRDAVRFLKLDLKVVRVPSMGQIAAAYGADVADNNGDDQTATRARFQDLMDLAAVYHVSEIQIKWAGEHAQVQFVVNEVLSDVVDEFKSDIASRIFTASYNLSDTNDGPMRTDIPQQAAINDPAKLPPGVFTARMQYVKLADGRLLKIRLSYREHALVKGGIAAAGLMPETLKGLRQLLTMNTGLVTFSGPIGSGKTTLGTVFLIELSEYHDNRWCILSVEDPPEGLDSRIISVAITNSYDPNFDPYDEALRIAKRIFPQAIRIGECRTEAASRTAYSASILGKTLVLTTIHADEGLDVGESYIRQGLTPDEAYDHRRHGAWVNQRLIPSICPHCAIPLASQVSLADPMRKEIYELYCAALGNAHASRLMVCGNGVKDGKTCVHCRPRNPRVCGACDRLAGTDCRDCPQSTQGLLVVGKPGIIGRLPAVEVLRPNRELMDRLKKRTPEAYDDARAYWLTEMGGKSLRLHAWRHLETGRIGAEEFLGSGITADQLAFDLRTLGVLH